MLSKYGNCTAQNEKQAENRLSLQIKSGTILDSLWAFLRKRFTRLVGLSTLSYPTSAIGIIVKYCIVFLAV